MGTVHHCMYSKCLWKFEIGTRSWLYVGVVWPSSHSGLGACCGSLEPSTLLHASNATFRYHDGIL